MHGSSSSSYSLGLPHHLPRPPLAHPQAPDGTTPTAQATTLAKLLKGWLSEVDRSALDDREAATAFFQQVVQGHPGDASIAQAVFNDLIAHEAYDVFVEVFSSYNTLMESQAKVNAKPFTSTLCLQLPRGWEPRAPEAMKQAFARVNVQRVEACRPTFTKDEHSPPIETLGFKTDTLPKPGWSIPVSTAACHLVAALLKGGATELAVHGPLRDPRAVQEAMDANPAFESLELGETRQGDPTDIEMAGYAILLMGTATASRLKQLTLRQAGFLNYLHKECGEAAPTLPALQSLTLKGSTEASCPHIRWFLAAVKSAPLSAVSLSIPGPDLGHLVEDILVELKSHPTLTALELDGPALSRHPLSNLVVSITALEVALSCPSFRAVAWDTGNDISNAGALMENAGMPSPHLMARAKAVGEALKAPACTLERVALRGVLMVRVLVESIFDALAENSSLQDLDLERSAVDIGSSQKLEAALKLSKTLRNTTLPTLPGYYYLTVKDPNDPTGEKEAIYGFSSVAPRSPSNGLPERQVFRPRSAPDGAFDPSLEAHANSLAQQWEERRQNMLWQSAYPELVSDVARLLEKRAVELDVRVGNDRLTGVASYRDPAAHVIAMLEQQGALRDIVHLSQLQKRAQVEGEPLTYATRREPAVKPFVRLRNAQAVADNLSNAPPWFNRVEESGANAEMMNAIRTNDPLKLSTLLSLNAIDFDGRAEQMAPLGPLRNAFLPINRLMNSLDHRGRNVHLQACVTHNDARGLRQWIAKGAIDVGGRVKGGAPKGLLRKSFLKLNRVDENDRNVQLQACVTRNDARGLRQWIAKGAIDFGGAVSAGAPEGPLRTSLLAVNRVDGSDANVQLVAAVKAGEASEVLRLRGLGAVDYGWQALKLAQEIGSDELRAAFVKDAVVPAPTTTVTTTDTTAATTTVTTTNTTAVTTTMPATSAIVLQTQVPRPDPDKPGS